MGAHNTQASLKQKQWVNPYLAFPPPHPGVIGYLAPKLDHILNRRMRKEEVTLYLSQTTSTSNRSGAEEEVTLHISHTISTSE